MKTRPLVLALAAALLVLTVSCGVEANDDATTKTDRTTAPKADDTTDPTTATTAPTDEGDDETTTTEPSDEGDDETTTTEPSSDDGGGDTGIPGLSRDDLVTQLKASGLTDAQAGCVADALIDAGFADMDPSSFDPSSEEYRDYIAAVQSCVMAG